jgi:hypothetical protein
MADKLKAYGEPHGTPIYVPAAFKGPEHWIAFVGGRAAQSAWLVTPTDKDHTLSLIPGWPTALAVDGGLVETVDHGLSKGPSSSIAWLLVTSLGGMGQPAGVHGVLRVEIAGAGFDNAVATDPSTLVPLAGVTRAEDIGAKVDAVSAESKKTIDLMSDEADEKLAAALGDPKTSDADLAALIPKGGTGVGKAYQELFVQPGARAAAPADLRAALGARHWQCSYTSCTAGDAIALLGTDGGKVVVRDVLLQPAPAAAAGAHVHEVVPPSTSTAITERTLRERGTLGAHVLAEAPYGAHGTIGVARADGGDVLVVKDGDYVATSTAHIDDSTTPEMLRFADVDGDGAPEVAIAGVEAPGIDESDLPGGPTYIFDTIGGEGHDQAAGLAAIGAANLDDAVARALAVPLRPVTPEQACKLIKDAKRSVKKAGPKARVFAFIEPSSPEIGHADLGKSGGEALKELVGDGCELVCDARRPACERPGMGPDTEYALFDWNGDKLELVLAMVYRGA